MIELYSIIDVNVYSAVIIDDDNFFVVVNLDNYSAVIEVVIYRDPSKKVKNLKLKSKLSK
jgi:hypothetical protein